MPGSRSRGQWCSFPTGLQYLHGISSTYIVESIRISLIAITTMAIQNCFCDCGHIGISDTLDFSEVRQVRHAWLSLEKDAKLLWTSTFSRSHSLYMRRPKSGSILIRSRRTLAKTASEVGCSRDVTGAGIITSIYYQLGFPIIARYGPGLSRIGFWCIGPSRNHFGSFSGFMLLNPKP